MSRQFLNGYFILWNTYTVTYGGMLLWDALPPMYPDVTISPALFDQLYLLGIVAPEKLPILVSLTTGFKFPSVVILRITCACAANSPSVL
jgi:hypothetical protein